MFDKTKMEVKEGSRNKEKEGGRNKGCKNRSSKTGKQSKEMIKEKECEATKHGSSKQRGRSKNLPGHIEPELGSKPLIGGHMKKEKQGLKMNKKRIT